MTLEEYRRHTVQKIRACADPAAIRDFVAEVDLVLLNSGISIRAHNAFWEALNEDLEVIAEEGTRLLGSEAASLLIRVIETARVEIIRLQLMETDDP